jgi:hypothetical protein
MIGVKIDKKGKAVNEVQRESGDHFIPLLPTYRVNASQGQIGGFSANKCFYGVEGKV